MIVTRAHQSTRERRLRELCSVGTSTTVDELTTIALAPTLYHPPHFDGNKGSSVCLAPAAVKVWEDCGSSSAIHPAHVHDTKGAIVCSASAAFKTWDEERAATTSACDEWPVLSRLAGSTPCPTYSSHGAASVGPWQSSADDGTAPVQDNYQHANRAPRLKPKRNGEAQSFVERFGVSEEEYRSDIACSHRSPEGRPMVKVGGVGKFYASDAIDFENGRPYVRKRERAPWAHPPEVDRLTVQSLVGPDVELPKGLAGASLRAPGQVGTANVLRERNPQLSAINDVGWERITLIVDSGASDTVIPPKVCRAAAIRHSSKVGTEYEVADGGVPKNIGEKLCEMKINEDRQIGSRTRIPSRR